MIGCEGMKRNVFSGWGQRSFGQTSELEASLSVMALASAFSSHPLRFGGDAAGGVALLSETWVNRGRRRGISPSRGEERTWRHRAHARARFLFHSVFSSSCSSLPLPACQADNLRQRAEAANRVASDARAAQAVAEKMLADVTVCAACWCGAARALFVGML